MSRFIKISTLLAVMLSISCRELPDYLVGSNTVARVGKKELSITEIKEAMPAGLTGEDSLAFSQLYIDKWLIRQLKIEEADQLFSSSEDDIERLVEEYRQSLLMRKVDQYYIDEQMSEDFSDEDIAEKVEKTVRDNMHLLMGGDPRNMDRAAKAPVVVLADDFDDED